MDEEQVLKDLEYLEGQKLNLITMLPIWKVLTRILRAIVERLLKDGGA